MGAVPPLQPPLLCTLGSCAAPPGITHGVTAPGVHLWVLRAAVPHILCLPQVVNPRKKMKKKKYLNSGTVRAG